VCLLDCLQRHAEDWRLQQEGVNNAKKVESELNAGTPPSVDLAHSSLCAHGPCRPLYAVARSESAVCLTTASQIIILAPVVQPHHTFWHNS